MLLSAFAVAAPSNAQAVSAVESLSQMETESADFKAIVAQVAAAWTDRPPHAVPLEFAYLDPLVLGESGRRLVAAATPSNLHFRVPESLESALAAATASAPAGAGIAASSASSQMRSSGAVLSRSSVSVPRPSLSSSSTTSGRPAMFAPKRPHPSLASAIASRAPVAPKHKVLVISTAELQQMTTVVDKDAAREEKQAQKLAEKTQKLKEREEKRLKRDEEKLEQKQARDAVRLLEKASKVAATPKKRKEPHSLAAGMGDLLAAGQESDDDDDDDDDDDGDDADEDHNAANDADTKVASVISPFNPSLGVGAFMSFANTSASAPQFPSARAPTSDGALARADELSKMLESVLTNKPAAQTQEPPAARHAAAALAGLTPLPTWPPQRQQQSADSAAAAEPAAAAAAATATAAAASDPSPQERFQAMLASVFEGADMSLVSAAQHQRIRQFLGGNRTNPDPSSPIHAIVLQRSIADDHEVTLFVELNYETATWRKVSRRRRLGLVQQQTSNSNSNSNAQ